ncbi:hypothetical protein acsn021_44320 [Anaerocolumna cellulosilytica]|uniref:Uncharacterized protein n=1 Tax=Anaerocolumna cellulosilytica TaxID=433286 RepID=A0A6S6R0A1_9FIRM|nr:hypothetical protein [Anaerocolumna cellulosilytica]MBB5195853.1 hypothetical protein [Anaerocolumna cellulosilytica]BCJ96863.1 hypothetical protein acsn021_44320 [Anaerocolumna cellulosilytica]
MKIFLKKSIARTIAILICTLLFLTDSYIVNAAQTIKSSEEFDITLDQYTELSEEPFFDVSNSEVGAKDVYNGLTDEAKVIFLEYLINNPDMYEYHTMYVGTNVNDELKLLSMDSVLMQSYTALNLTQTLSNNLDLINGLSVAVKYALVGVGSSIVAIGSNITVAQLVGLLVAAGCLAVLVANWDNVNTHWTAIVSAFKTTFKSLMASANIEDSFTTAKPSYTTVRENINKALGTYRNGNPTASFSKHIDSAYALPVVRSRNPLAIYYSHIQNKVLMVYNLGVNQRANVNQDFNSHSTWQLPNFDVSGGKLYVLFNPSNKSYFHAHIRLLRDDTEFMRYGNQMSWQIYQVMSYDVKYEVGGPTYLQGNIYQ